MLVSDGFFVYEVNVYFQNNNNVGIDSFIYIVEDGENEVVGWVGFCINGIDVICVVLMIEMEGGCNVDIFGSYSGLFFIMVIDILVSGVFEFIIELIEFCDMLIYLIVFIYNVGSFVNGIVVVVLDGVFMYMLNMGFEGVDIFWYIGVDWICGGLFELSFVIVMVGNGVSCTSVFFIINGGDNFVCSNMVYGGICNILC